MKIEIFRIKTFTSNKEFINCYNFNSFLDILGFLQQLKDDYLFQIFEKDKLIISSRTIL